MIPFYLRTDLGLRHHGVVPVAERRELEPHLGLAVALHEELLDAARRPLKKRKKENNWDAGGAQEPKKVLQSWVIKNIQYQILNDIGYF